MLKFANYFLSRKHVHQLKSSYYMLAAVNTLTDNKVRQSRGYAGYL